MANTLEAVSRNVHFFLHVVRILYLIRHHKILPALIIIIKCERKKYLEVVKGTNLEKRNFFLIFFFCSFQTDVAVSVCVKLNRYNKITKICHRYLQKNRRVNKMCVASLGSIFV